MRAIVFFSMIWATTISVAQTSINKTILVKPNQRIIMHFDYPNLIRVSTWDKNEISIQGTVSINGGENDDAFILDSSIADDRISISSQIKDMKNLPHRITVMKDGKKMVFKDKSEWKKYKSDYHDKHNWMSEGVDIDITLEIKVPKKTNTRVESVYGMVEVKDFVGPIVVDATYGGVDAALNEKAVGELTAETDYGQIYSNLDTKISGGKVEDFHTEVSIKLGVGARYAFESKYGNVYLRKQGN